MELPYFHLFLAIWFRSICYKHVILPSPKWVQDGSGLWAELVWWSWWSRWPPEVASWRKHGWHCDNNDDAVYQHLCCLGKLSCFPGKPIPRNDFVMQWVLKISSASPSFVFMSTQNVKTIYAHGGSKRSRDIANNQILAKMKLRNMH